MLLGFKNIGFKSKYFSKKKGVVLMKTKMKI